MNLGDVKRYIAHALSDSDWIITIILGAIVSVLGISGHASQHVLASAVLLLLGILAFGALRDRYAGRGLRALIHAMKADDEARMLLSDRTETGVERVFPHTVDFDWLPEIEAATAVTIAKLKLNFTNSPSYYDAFEHVLAKQGYVTIVMSNPLSPAVWLRYKEEPTPASDHPGLSETAWINGLQELAIELHSLDTWRQRLISEGTDISRLTIKASSRYPTHAYYQFDNKLYVYHYPYFARGFHAPAFLFANPATPTHKFLTRCLSSVVDDADPLEGVMSDVWREYESGRLTDTLAARARIRVDLDSFA